MSFKEYWGKQFGNPTGLSGKIATFIMNRMNQSMYNAVLKQIKNNAKILDIGFGNGYLFKKLLRKSNSQFYGIDFSSDMVKNASKRNFRHIKNGRLFLANASADSLPFEINFDQIYTINTVYFWNDLNKGITEIFNNLATGGEFLIVCYTKQWLDKLGYTKSYKKYTEEELLNAVQSVGFRAEIVPIKNGKSFYINATKIN